MTLNPFGLLNLIGAAGRALSPNADRARQLSTADLDRLDFDTLLQRATGGRLESGRPVVLGAGADVELSAEQLQRLSAAADRAEANGARDALVLMDGMALRVDVESRRVVGAVDPGAPQLLTGIDAVVTAPEAGAPETLPVPPGAGAANPSLLRILADAGA